MFSTAGSGFPVYNTYRNHCQPCPLYGPEMSKDFRRLVSIGFLTFDFRFPSSDDKKAIAELPCTVSLASLHALSCSLGRTSL